MHESPIVRATLAVLLAAAIPAVAFDVRLTPNGLVLPELGVPVTMLTPQKSTWKNGGMCPSAEGFNTMKDGEMAYRLCEMTGHSWTYPLGDGHLSAHVADGVLHVTNTVRFSADAALAVTMFFLRIPRTELEGGRWRVDSREGTWGELGKPLHTKGRSLSVDLPKRGRMLTFTFPELVGITVQDDRMHKMESMSLWFGDPRGRVRKAGETWKCAFTLAAGEPMSFSATEKLVVGSGAGWVPLDYRKDILAGSALDFSGQGMADAPAGRHGWLKNHEGRFVFEGRPGKSQRFYGVNLCGNANMPPGDVADMLVTRLSRLGYNSIRVHHHDNPLDWRKTPGHVFHAGKMDRFDHLLARAFAAGLYVTTDLYVSREVAWRDIGEQRDGLVPKQMLKGLFMLTNAGFETWAAFARDFLEHVNPYTGRAYKDEPGMPLLSLINENPLSMGWHELREYPLVKKLWRERFGTDDCAKVEENDGRLATFTAEAEERFFSKAKSMLLSIGAKALLTDLNCGGCDPAGCEVRSRLFGYADMHFYIDHPKFPVERWKLPAFVGSSNPLRTPRLMPFQLRQSLHAPALPFVSTEWSFTGPGRYRGVGGIATGIAAAANGWSGAWRFAYTHTFKAIPYGKGCVNWFDLAGDPLQQTADRAVICLFLRGDLAEGDASRYDIDSARGTMTINTPRTCGGFVEAGAFEAGPLKVDVGEVPASVWVSSVDGRGVARSRRLVLTHLTDVQGAGTAFGDASRSLLLSWGGSTPMVQDGAADVSLALDDKTRYTVFALATDGSRLDEVPVRRDGRRIMFTARVRGPDGKARMIYEIFGNQQE